MPIYLFRCGGCDYEWEHLSFQILEDDMHCPKCGHVATRVVSAPALSFKGSGFYVNEYGAGSRKSDPDLTGGGDGD